MNAQPRKLRLLDSAFLEQSIQCVNHILGSGRSGLSLQVIELEDHRSSKAATGGHRNSQIHSTQRTTQTASAWRSIIAVTRGKRALPTTNKDPRTAQGGASSTVTAHAARSIP